MSVFIKQTSRTKGGNSTLGRERRLGNVDQEFTPNNPKCQPVFLKGFGNESNLKFCIGRGYPMRQAGRAALAFGEIRQPQLCGGEQRRCGECGDRSCGSIAGSAPPQAEEIAQRAGKVFVLQVEEFFAGQQAAFRFHGDRIVQFVISPKLAASAVGASGQVGCPGCARAAARRRADAPPRNPLSAGDTRCIATASGRGTLT